MSKRKQRGVIGIVAAGLMTEKSWLDFQQRQEVVLFTRASRLALELTHSPV
jgi:hypothetical protein